MVRFITDFFSVGGTNQAKSSTKHNRKQGKQLILKQLNFDEDSKLT